MAQKQLLQELLKQNQEPFHLKTYISDKRSHLKNKPSPIIISTKGGTNLRHQTCFSSHQKSPAASTMSPRKSPSTVFLRVPPKTAEILLESATRIRNPQKSKLQPQIKSVGLGFFGSFLKILKDRSKRKKIFRNSDADESEKTDGDIISRGLSGGGKEACPNSTCWQYEELDQIINGNFGLLETRYCASPFRFSFCQSSSSSSGRNTPELCSPVVSPSRRVNQEKENCSIKEHWDDVNTVDDAEKEQCSPVSVLDSFFEDDGHESPNDVEDDHSDDYDLECSYANVQRAKQQLLDRLRRFEKLAELDPMELERSFLEDSEDEHEPENVVSEDDPEPSYEKKSVERFLNEAFCLSNLHHNSKKSCIDKNRLVSDLRVEKKRKTPCFGNNEVVLEFNMVVDLDLKTGFEGLEEMVGEIEVAILEQLLQEFVLHG